MKIYLIESKDEGTTGWVAQEAYINEVAANVQMNAARAVWPASRRFRVMEMDLH